MSEGRQPRLLLQFFGTMADFSQSAHSTGRRADKQKEWFRRKKQVEGKKKNAIKKEKVKQVRMLGVWVGKEEGVGRTWEEE